MRTNLVLFSKKINLSSWYFEECVFEFLNSFRKTEQKSAKKLQPAAAAEDNIIGKSKRALIVYMLTFG